MTIVVLMAFLTIAAFVVSGASGTNDRPGVAALSFAGGVFFLILFGLDAASLSRGEIPSTTQSLSQCGLREGVVYRNENNTNHTDYRNLVVLRDESDFSHRACMVRESLPERFVVIDDRAVAVDEASDRAPVGDTEWEQSQAERERRQLERLSQQDDDGEEPIVVYGQRP